MNEWSALSLGSFRSAKDRANLLSKRFFSKIPELTSIEENAVTEAARLIADVWLACYDHAEEALLIARTQSGSRATRPGGTWGMVDPLRATQLTQLLMLESVKPQATSICAAIDLYTIVEQRLQGTIALRTLH